MTHPSPTFEQLGLSSPLLQALQQVGYETPSPIQAMGIPPLLRGRDVLGQAQTGTGKTAAFALPVLQQLDMTVKRTQALVLTPTRELAIQVAEAFQSYAHFLPGFHVMPIYGGQAYDKQIQALKRGVQVVVGTPGRVMDHMRKGTLKLDGIRHFVLDEADEMLRMGFIDDVEWILGHAPSDRQIALFSATMPKAIAKVANTYLRNPEHITIEVKTTTAATIRQRYWPVSGLHKLDAITRILEVESFDAMIIFVRTKTTTIELAEKLEARGFSAAALNGDIAQAVRERTVEKLKNGQIDILVATDVAARGLDVDRISHVLNYDIPYDTEAYVHRIGRTGRAGRAGEAILFVAKREMRMLHAIEKATGQPITPMKLPSAADINEQRVMRFKQKIHETLSGEDLQVFLPLIEQVQAESDRSPLEIAAALATLYQGDQPLFLNEREPPQRADFSERERPARAEREGKKEKRKSHRESDVDMETYRVEVGRKDGVRPGDLVGAIANEAGLDSEFIGHIKIHDDHCTVDLPKGMPPEVFRILQKTWVCQRQLQISLASGDRGKKPRRFERDRHGAPADFGEAPPAKQKKSFKKRSK
jgi:ATP-dependent RNA helicase DeaD